MSCISDLVCEVGFFFVWGRLWSFHLYYPIFWRFDCIHICSCLVFIIGEGFYIFIWNRLHVIMQLDHKIFITAISGSLFWVSRLFERPCKMNFKRRIAFFQIRFSSPVSAIVTVESELVYDVKAYQYHMIWSVRIFEATSSTQSSICWIRSSKCVWPVISLFISASFSWIFPSDNSMYSLIRLSYILRYMLLPKSMYLFFKVR